MIYAKNTQNKNITITLFNNEKYVLKPNEIVELGEHSLDINKKLFKILEKEIKVYEICENSKNEHSESSRNEELIEANIINNQENNKVKKEADLLKISNHEKR